MKVVSRIFYFILVIVIGVTIYLAISIDILPNRYYLPIIVLFFLLLVLLGLFVFSAKKTWSNLVLTIIFILLIAGSGFVSYYLYKTNIFLSNLGKVEKEEVVYYVLVKKDSEIKDVKELEDKTVGTYSFNANYYDDVYNKFKGVVNFKEKNYNNVDSYVNDLLNGKISAIFISSNHKEILEEEMISFRGTTRVLYEVMIEVSKDEEEKVEVEEFLEKPFSVYISGIDTSGSISTVSRSDVNIVMTISPKTGEILLTTIPRDYYVRLHNTRGYKDKLTHAGIYGIDMSRQTIEDLLDIKIDYYVRVNFTTLIKVIDTLGGVDVYSDQSFSEFGYSFKQGMNHLNGKQALMFSRIRHVFSDGDKKRGIHQQAVIEAIIKKVTSSKTLLLNYAKLLDTLKKTFQTNVDSLMIKEMVKFQLNEMPNWNIKSISLDGSGSSQHTYSMPSRVLYVLIPSESSINNAKKYLTGINEGKTFNEIDNPVVENAPEEATK